MRFLLIIALAIFLYMKNPSLFAWNGTGLTTLIIFVIIIAIATFKRKA